METNSTGKRESNTSLYNRKTGVALKNKFEGDQPSAKSTAIQPPAYALESKINSKINSKIHSKTSPVSYPQLKHFPLAASVDGEANGEAKRPDISLVLRGESVRKPQLREHRNTQSVEGPKNKLSYTTSHMEKLFVALDPLARIAAASALVIVLFLYIPKKFRLIWGLIKPTEYFDFTNSTIEEKIYLTAGLFISVPMLMLLISEFFPHFRKFTGLNDLDDRMTLLARYGNFGPNAELSTPLCRLYLLTLATLISIGMGFKERTTTITILAAFGYFGFTTIIIYMQELFKNPTISTPFQVTKKGKEKKNQTEFWVSRSNFIVLTILRAVMFALNLSLAAMCCFVLNENYTLPAVLCASILFGFLGYNTIEFLENCENAAIFIQYQAQIVISFFVFAASCFICELAGSKVKICSAVFNIALLVLGITTAILSKPKPKQKQHYESQKVEQFANSVYFFILVVSFVFAAAIGVIVTEELDDYGAANWCDSIVKHAVYWCDKTISEKSKMGLYDMDITESEVILKVFILSYSGPIVIMIFIIVYYIMADRDYNSSSRETLLYIPSLLFGFVMLSTIFSIVIEQFVDHIWVWDAVAASKIELVELRNYIRINDLVVIGVVGIFVVYVVGDYDVDGANDMLGKIKLKSLKGNVSPDERRCCMYVDQIPNRFISTIFAMILICGFFYAASDDGDKLIRAGPMTYERKSWMKKAVLKPESCDRKMVNFANEIQNDPKWKQSIDAIKSTQSKPQTEELVDSGYLVAAAMTLLMAQLSLNLACLFSKSAQLYSARLSALLLTLAIPCLFFGACLFPALYFFAYSFIFPFYQVEFTDKFMAALVLNVGAFVPPMVALAENLLEIFPLVTRDEVLTGGPAETF